MAARSPSSATSPTGTQVATEISRLARQVAGEVTDRPVARVVVKVRYAPFDTITHGCPLPAGEQSPPGVPPPHGEPLPLNDTPEPGVPPGKPDAPDPAAAHAAWAATIELAAAAALAKFTPGRPSACSASAPSSPTTVPIETAGDGPGCPAAASGLRLPGRVVVPAGPVAVLRPGGAAVGPGGCRRSSARCCGCRVLWGQLSGGRSAGRCRSRLPVAAPGARGRAARSPRRRRDGRRRGPESGAAGGRASARRPTWMCRPGRRRSPRVPRCASSGRAGHGTSPWGCRTRAPGTPGPAGPATAGSRPVPGPARGRGRSRGSRSRPRAPRARGRCRSGWRRRPGPGRPAWLAGSPASTRGIVTGGPAGLPSGVSAQAARCPAFTSTATTGWRGSSPRQGRGRAASSSSRPGTGGG